jgi:hypothetical protein
LLIDPAYPQVFVKMSIKTQRIISIADLVKGMAILDGLPGSKTWAKYVIFRKITGDKISMI